MHETVNSSASSVQQAGSAKPARQLSKLIIVVALLLPTTALGVLGWKYWKPEPPRDFAAASGLGLDLNKPDALIESTSLAKLPKDLLDIPLLRDTLTEDFVFYYEVNADRLGLAGSLRRIIYEHDLQLKDTLINDLLDEPATVALWHGQDGKLAHILLLIKRSGLAALMETLAKVALNDNQLSIAGTLHVDGEEVPLYRLRYAPAKTLLLASANDQMLVLSSPGMMLESDESTAKLAKDAVESVEALLAGDHSLSARFGLDASKAKQRLTLSADFFALGYRSFFPALAGIRFEKDGSGWKSFIAFDPIENQQSLDFAPLWQAMPMGASACFAVPVSADMPQRVLKRLGATPSEQALLKEQLGGPAALCWYPSSRLHTPLIVTRMTKPANPEIDDAVNALFEKLVGTWEAKANEAKFPVEVSEQNGTKTWVRQVGSNFGQYPASQAQDPQLLASNGFFRVSLARHADTWVFSIDDKLVAQALATLDRRYPPLMEKLPQGKRVPAYFAPETLAPLLEQEALDSLPENMEPVFHNAAKNFLLPKLHTFAKKGKFAITFPDDTTPDNEWQWLPLAWQSL